MNSDDATEWDLVQRATALDGVTTSWNLKAVANKVSFHTTGFQGSPELTWLKGTWAQLPGTGTYTVLPKRREESRGTEDALPFKHLLSVLVGQRGQVGFPYRTKLEHENKP